MKKVLLFAVFALSINANAQNLHPISNNHHHSSNPMGNILEKVKDDEGHPSVNVPEKNFIEMIKHQTMMLLPPVQIYDSLYQWEWDTDTFIMDWKVFAREIDIVYDANNNLTRFIIQLWDGSEWVNYYQNVYTYDVNHNQTSELGQTWDGSEWVNSYQNIYTYDANNNKTSEVDQYWYGSSWKNSDKSIYTYDANNNQTKEIYQGWNGSSWENSEQYLYTYNIHNKQTRQINQSWDSGAWRNDVQYIYTYDAFNNRTSELGQDWDIINAIWVNTYKNDYTYDGNHNLTNAIYYSWDGIAWLISTQYQYMYTFDANQNLTNQLGQVWNGTSWVIYFQVINTYDSDNFKISQSHRSYSESGSVEEYSDSIHYYSHTVTGINDLSTGDSSITLNPNPSSGKFTISSTSTLRAIEIYNLLGERIYSDHSIQQTPGEIDLSAQGKGIYFINMYDGTKVHNKKIVVQ